MTFARQERHKARLKRQILERRIADAKAAGTYVEGNGRCGPFIVTDRVRECLKCGEIDIRTVD